MRRSKITRHDHPQMARQVLRRLSWLGAMGSFALLASAVILMALAVANFARADIPVSGASGTGGATPPPGHLIAPSQRQHTCGFDGLPACPTPADGWTPLASQSPGDVVAAARKSPLLNVSPAGTGDYLHDVSRLGTPQLVRAFLAPAGASMPDYYLIPVLGPANQSVGVAMVELNAARTAVRVVDVVTYAQPIPGGGVTRITANAAIGAMMSQHRVAMRTGSQPQLVYFPFDFAAQDAGSVSWHAGGDKPYDPIWLLAGADGIQRLVGTDGHVYLPTDLPANR
jgi:hypothetical protein